MFCCFSTWKSTTGKGHDFVSERVGVCVWILGGGIESQQYKISLGFASQLVKSDCALLLVLLVCIPIDKRHGALANVHCALKNGQMATIRYTFEEMTCLRKKIAHGKILILCISVAAAGMQVLEWNGIPLTAKTYEEVQGIVGQPCSEAELCVRLWVTSVIVYPPTHKLNAPVFLLQYGVSAPVCTLSPTPISVFLFPFHAPSCEKLSLSDTLLPSSSG